MFENQKQYDYILTKSETDDQDRIVNTTTINFTIKDKESLIAAITLIQLHIPKAGHVNNLTFSKPNRPRV